MAASLLPDKVTGNDVVVFGGTIPGRIFGGARDGTSRVDGNTVLVLGGSAGQGVVGGFNSRDYTDTSFLFLAERGGRAANNEVVVMDGELAGAVGAHASGLARANSLVIAGGSVTTAAHGGLSRGNARDNSVLVTGGRVEAEVSGAHSMGGHAKANRATLAGTGHVDAIYGATSKKKAQGNLVLMEAGTVDGAAVGGQSNSDVATENSVTVLGGHIRGDVMGGIARDGEASHNYVRFGSTGKDAAPSCQGIVIGGMGNRSAEANEVEVQGGSIAGTVAGGQGVQLASGNTAVIAGGTLHGLLVGGRSVTKACSNIVNVRGGTVGDIVGGLAVTAASTKMPAIELRPKTVPLEARVAARQDGRSPKGSVCHNKLHIEGGTVTGTVSGGYSQVGWATNNTVTLCAGVALPAEGFVLGGESGAGGDVFTGNTLVVERQVSAGSVANFEKLTFRNPPREGSALRLAGMALLGADVAPSRIDLLFDDERVKAEELAGRYVLVEAARGLAVRGDDPVPARTEIVRGDAHLRLRIAVEGNALVAYVEKAPY